ncbi:MAG: iron-containing alcohol dehydrogenase family protein [Bacteroidales bacterium]|nr:iron-containing alcohol dehydrogenase family protein [Bacteroidales bacterium]MCM1415218.1 iron-containing alcohol dehydrogenase family protein [bacterium]MCM1423788.1 iron-containing alcohol dehydrogenase family protein [bacterium]
MNRFQLPGCLIIEEGACERLNEILADCVPGIEGKRVIIATEEALIPIMQSCLDEMQRDLPKSELYLIGENSFDEAMKLAKRICMADVEVIIGVGGGKVLDVAKYAGFVGKIPYICVPTTLSNDSLSSPVAVLGTEGDARKTLKCAIPAAIVVDVDVVMGAPLSQLQSGIGDTISKYTALYDWKLDAAYRKERVDDFSYLLSDMAFSSLCYNEEKSLKSKEFIKILTQSLVLGGLAMEIAGNSRPCSGSEHLFCHSLEENHKEIQISHGMAVALGSLVSCRLQGRDGKLLRSVLRAYHMDMDPMNWGITEEIFADAWLRAADTRKDRHTILNEVTLTEALLHEIYESLRAEKEMSENPS